MEITLNMFDLIVATVIGLSALLSFFRGFLREIFSLAGWAVAAIVTLRFLEPASGFVKPHVGSEVMASGIAAVGLFFITLVLVSVVSGLVLKFLKPAAKIGLFDNLAGLAFGVARGVLIIALGYFMMSVVIAEKNYPDWIKTSASKPYVERCTHWIAEFAPAYLDKIAGSKDKGELSEETKKGVDALIQTFDSGKERIVEGAEDAAQTIEEKSSELPSMEDLQQRIKEENERQ
jgi:membrane protein required for colicin V production